MGYMAPVENGVIDSTAISSTKVDMKGQSSLGKDAFLQLLVAQMKYQDPLKPSSDTEWIAQMAQFSSLEQMQNMNATMSNVQAFSMIGQTVQISADEKVVEGVVDFVNVSGGVSYVSVNGNTYEASKVISVLSAEYLQNTYGPKVPEQKVTYDYAAQEDIKLSVSLGEKEYAASGMYVAIGEALIDSKYLKFDEKNNILTVSKDAFYGLKTGESYDVRILFDDKAGTVATGQVTLKVTGAQPEGSLKENTDEQMV